ncbi:receptor-like protein kinase ANXUR2 [Mercurialis annua]|uniref:receptor-like protein kinase ANXUR2 n=1 Tax=Mercurialis annua TaxID=3986 RepID=UPI0024ACFB40|nr:receptor-like protein kinase ANXUR2 [Mercurialis annua]
MNRNVLVLFSFISFFTISYKTTLVSCKDPDSYVLACGAPSDGTDGDGRTWVADTKHVKAPGNSIVAAADTQDPSLPSTVPYMTGRLFTNEFTYTFPVPSTSRIWVRLHFYPATYSSLDPNNAFFDVTANKLQLLKNFSASITAKALTMAYIIREYSLSPVNTGNLAITFTPTKGNSDTYAFVNGIEVIPMPDIYQSAGMVGFSDQTVDLTASSMQTMFRLNVGGQFIPSTNDSGLTRIWYDDTPYIFGAGVGITNQANIKIQYPTTDVPKSIAPYDVYSTSRSMGTDSKVNVNFNLTWLFDVDANFTYLVRFHFCEYELTRANQRAFNIYINNQTAQEGADVIGWGGSKGVPVFKDYAMYVGDQAGDDELWVALHPSVELKPEYYDAILNGLEVFKLSDPNGNMAGPNPVPSAMLQVAEEKKKFKPKSSNGGPIIGAIAGGAAGLAVAAIISIFVLRKKRGLTGSQSGSHNWLPLYGQSHTSGSKSTISGKSTASSHLSSVAQGLCRHFSLPEIKHATKNFDENNVIGVGGFGKVYKGIIDHGTKVAIKRSNPSSEQGVNEFNTEIEMLSKLRHKHLVSLIGFCEEDGEMALVYDYMANGTMREHIYRGNKPTCSLSWKQRLEICIGAARGLHYLHTGAKYTIIHRDVKTTNILLDEKWVAKVSDFGLSKTGPNLNSQSHVSTVVKGSFGYLDPEYFKRQQLTEKSDVYSFGVVLFEALCARPALNPNLAKEQVSLADWALHCQKKGIIEDMIDPHIKSEIQPECLKKFAETAEKCLSDHGINRPSMGDILWNLEFALQLQDNPAGAKLVSEKKGIDTYGITKQMHSIEEESSHSEDTDEFNNTEIFSQIVNPRGR